MRYTGYIKIYKNKYEIIGPEITLFKDSIFFWYKAYDLSWYQYGKYSILNDTLILSYYKINDSSLNINDSLFRKKIKESIDSNNLIEKIEKFIIHGNGLFLPENNKFKTSIVKMSKPLLLVYLFHKPFIHIYKKKKYKYFFETLKTK